MTFFKLVPRYRPIPEVIPPELYLELVPSSPSVNVTRALCGWEINSLTLHPLLVHYNSFTIFLRNSFHDIVLLLLFYFLYLAKSFKAIPDSQSFLFTLINPSGNEPIKINPKPNAAIRCKSDTGPTFGDSLTHYDLRVWYLDNSSFLDLGYGFTCPENVNRKTYFAGESRFQVSELEVFKVYL